MPNTDDHNDKKAILAHEEMRFIRLIVLLVAAIILYLSSNHSYLVHFVESF